MSEREAVIAYLEARLFAAWDDGKFEEAFAVSTFLEHLEGLTESNYEAQYADPIEAGDIA